jgi:hypothetical protein
MLNLFTSKIAYTEAVSGFVGNFTYTALFQNGTKLIQHATHAAYSLKEMALFTAQEGCKSKVLPTCFNGAKECLETVNLEAVLDTVSPVNLTKYCLENVTSINPVAGLLWLGIAGAAGTAAYVIYNRCSTEVPDDEFADAEEADAEEVEVGEAQNRGIELRR